MNEPRFKTGDLVRVEVVPPSGADSPFISIIARDGPSGIFEVSAVLTDPFGPPRYRVKRSDGTPERIVRECQLLPAVRKLSLPVEHPPHGTLPGSGSGFPDALAVDLA